MGVPAVRLSKYELERRKPAPGKYQFFHTRQRLTDLAAGIELPLGPLFE